MHFLFFSYERGYVTVAVMFEKLKDKALRAALPLLAGSAVGRMVIDKGLAIVAKKVGVPVKGDYCKETETWRISVGEPGAPVQALVNITNDALSALLEELVPDLVNERPIPRERVLELLQKYLCAPCATPKN